MLNMRRNTNILFCFPLFFWIFTMITLCGKEEQWTGENIIWKKKIKQIEVSQRWWQLIISLDKLPVSKQPEMNKKIKIKNKNVQMDTLEKKKAFGDFIV